MNWTNMITWSFIIVAVIYAKFGDNIKKYYLKKKLKKEGIIIDVKEVK